MKTQKKTQKKTRSPLYWLVIALLLLGALGACAESTTVATTATTTTTTTTTTASAKPTAQPKPKPTAKPKPTPTLQEQYASLVRGDNVVSGQDTAITVTYDASADSLAISANIGEQVSDSFAATQIKWQTFSLMQAIYTAGHGLHHPQVVHLRLLGPATDQYGNTIPDDLYATATLTRTTAALFNWPNLDQDTAWGDYDSTYVAPYLQSSFTR